MERRIFVKKFTGSEWKLNAKGDHVYAYDNNDNYVSIARVDAGDTAQAQANARLIANAPRMYERLKLLARLISRQAQGQLQDKIDPAIADSIYELLGKIDNEPTQTMTHSSIFFQNRNCEYFPCHNGTDPEGFSCLFCFCPLYHMEKCPGSPRILSNEVKDCSGCTLPHRDYEAVIRVLKQEVRV